MGLIGEPLPFGPWWEVYRRLVSGGDDFAVVPAALSFGHILQGGTPWPEAEARLRRLEEVAVRHAPSGSEQWNASATAIVELLVAEGFTGDGDDYEDPHNSLLDRVLQRRRGLPIALSVLAIHLARHAGVPLRGIGFPGHFVVGIGLEGNEPLVFDPFRNGQILREDDLRDLLIRATGRRSAPGQWRRFVRPASGRDITMRMLRNLVVHLHNAGRATHAAAARRLLQITTTPEAPNGAPVPD